MGTVTVSFAFPRLKSTAAPPASGLLRDTNHYSLARDEFADITFSVDSMKADAGWDGHPLAARMAAASTNYDLPQKKKDILAAATDGHVSQSKILGTLIEARYPDPIDLVLCTRVAALIERLQCRRARFATSAGFGDPIPSTPHSGMLSIASGAAYVFLAFFDFFVASRCLAP